jgi:hypothetical protein
MKDKLVVILVKNEVSSCLNVRFYSSPSAISNARSKWCHKEVIKYVFDKNKKNF